MDLLWRVAGSVLASVLATALATMLTRRALAARARIGEGGQLVLQYPTIIKVFMGVGGALISALGALVPWISDIDQRTSFDVGVLIVISLGIATLGVACILEVLLVRVVVNEDGLSSFTPWRGRRFIAWSHVAEVTFSRATDSFTVRATDRSVIRANRHLAGIREFYGELQRRLPPSAWHDFDPPF